jgi:hypothetical protein
MAFVLMSFAFIWLISPYRVIEIDDFLTSQTTYNQGERVDYSFEYRKYTDLNTLVNREIVNSTVFHIDSYVANLPKTQNDSWQHFHNGFVLPSGIEAGDYRVRLVYIVKVNPIRTVTKVFESEVFTVVK